MAEVKSGAIYRHYKGDYYIVKCLAKNSETGEQMVVYQALYGDGEVWCRPLEMFLEELPDAKDGAEKPKQKHRFELQRIKSVRDS